MTRKAGELARVKLQMLELMIARPDISTNELSRLTGIDSHTGAKYRAEISELILKLKTDIESKIEQKIVKSEGIWQKIAAIIN